MNELTNRKACDAEIATLIENRLLELNVTVDRGMRARSDIVWGESIASCLVDLRGVEAMIAQLEQVSSDKHSWGSPRQHLVSAVIGILGGLAVWQISTAIDDASSAQEVPPGIKQPLNRGANGEASVPLSDEPATNSENTSGDDPPATELSQ